MISLRFSPETKKFLAYLDSGPARVRYAMAQATYRAAQELQNSLTERLPKTKTFAGLRTSLRLGKVQMGAVEAYGVYSDTVGMRKTKVRKLDPVTSVVYVRPKRGRMVRVPETIRILQQFSPWALDALPFFPNKREAAVISRKVSEREVVRVRELRDVDRPQWEALLAKEGVRVSAATKVKLPPRAAVVEDTAFQAVRLEFGGGDQPARPIWRPAIRSLAKKGVRSMLGGSAMLAMGDPSFLGFKSLPRGEIDLSESSLTKYKGFQKRIL